MTKKTDGKSTAAKDAPGIEENSAVAQIAGALEIEPGSVTATSAEALDSSTILGRPPRLDTTPLDTLLIEIGDVPDELYGLSLINAKREATFNLSAAINAMKVLRKLSA